MTWTQRSSRRYDQWGSLASWKIFAAAGDTGITKADHGDYASFSTFLGHGGADVGFGDRRARPVRSATKHAADLVMSARTPLAPPIMLCPMSSEGPVIDDAPILMGGSYHAQR